MKEFDKATHLTISIFFFVTVAILAALYVYWFRVSPPDPTSFVPATLDYALGLILVFIYAFLGLMLTVTKRHLLFVPTALLLCISAAYSLHSMPSLVSTAECHGTIYNISDHRGFHRMQDYYQLTKWTGPFQYATSFFGVFYVGGVPSKIICAEKTNDVWIFDAPNRLTYHNGAQSYYYETSSFEYLNDTEYYIKYYDLGDTRSYILTVCPDNKPPETCRIVPVGHPSPLASDERGSLIVDRNTQDVYLLFDGKLDSAYGDPTRKFETLASVTTEAGSARAQYSIAAYMHDNAYVYVLYGCDVTNNYDQFTSCYALPFSYSTPGRETASLAIDPAADQLSVTVGDRLVFTYTGVYSDPYCDSGCLATHCYADRCLIPPPLP